MDAARFLAAQQDVFDQVLDELHAGEKMTHWMWFIFPQLAGLGYSAMAQRYALDGAADALAYLRHPVLGPRLLTCTHVVAGLATRSAQDIFGSTDAVKFHSSMTLFDFVAPAAERTFADCLDIYFGGVGDPASLMRLRQIERA